MKFIYQVHQETHEIIDNLNAAVRSGEITLEQRNEIILACFKAEAKKELK